MPATRSIVSFSGAAGPLGLGAGLIRTIALVPEEPALAARCLELTRASLHPFPELEVGVEPSGPRIEARAWASPQTEFLELDRAIFDANSSALTLAGPAELLPRTALEVVTRYQALLERTNAASCTPEFDALRALHRDAHDLDKPLVHADYFHALDCWQWTLRLAPQAGFALQAAALFHDVERLLSEADVRIEHRAADYQAFKDAHAREGGAILRDLLAATGVDDACADRAAWLVVHHERPDSDEELALLNDADALSFFSLNAFGYLNYFGPEQTRKKVAYTLARMRPPARAHLRTMRLPELVREGLA